VQHHEAHRLGHQLVVVLVVAALGHALERLLEAARHRRRLGRLLAPEVGHVPDLALGDVRRMHAQRLGLAGGKIEHVAHAEEVLGAVHVEDGAAVGLRRHLERDPRTGSSP
jgi:hypothetical protein